MADVTLESTEEIIQLTSVSGASQGDIISAVNAHNLLDTGVHGVGLSTVASAADVSTAIAAHDDLATAHGLTGDDWAAIQGAASPSVTNILMTRSAIAPWLGEINVRDYGTGGAGVTNDTAGIQAAINATISQSTTGRGGSLIIPPGIYDIYDTLTITGVVGFDLMGSGCDSILRWRGAADRPLLSIVDAQQVKVEDLEIDAATALDVGIRVWRSGAVNPANRKNKIRNVVINNATFISDGIVLGGAGTYDANNDFNTLEDCFVSSSRYNYVVTGSQSFKNVFVRCDAWSGQRGVYASGGYFEWYGGSNLSHSDYDFRVESSAYQPIVISGVISESSKRFVYINSLSGGTTEISHCRWACDNIAADGEVMLFRQCGHVRMVNNKFGDSLVSIVPVINWQAMRGYVQNWYRGSGFEFVGNQVWTNTVTPTSPFSGDVPTYMRDNSFIHQSTSDSFPMPRYQYTLTVDSTTPNIDQTPENFLEANANPTSITDFTGGFQGKTFTIEFTTANTTIVAGAPIRLAGGVDFVGSQYDTLTLCHNGTCWIEVGRSVNA